MNCGCGVKEAKTNGSVDSFRYAAQVDRPENRRVGFDCDQFASEDCGALICDPHPPQIELLPSPERFTSSAEEVFTISKFRPGQIVHETIRRRAEQSIS
jgi:hypothetical protein